MARRRFSYSLLIAILLVAFGPLAEGWLHVADSSHPESHLFEAATPEVTDNHRDCDAWQATSDRHNAHQELQFEPAQTAHHGDHAALCPACSHLVSAVTVGLGVDLDHPAKTHLSSRLSSSACGVATGHIRPRAPPLA